MQTSTAKIKREVGQYIIRNTLASSGLSLYVLVDTVFIAVAGGTLGLAALNISLPMFNFFNSLGLLFGIGGSTIYSIHKINEPNKVTTLFGKLLLFCLGLGSLLALLLNIFPTQVLTLLGADQQTMGVALGYFRIIALGAPFFMCNYVCVNFIRNDGNPQLTMIATLTATLVVVFLDWLLIFVFQLHMIGAAIATIFSPLTSMAILTFHRKYPKRQLQLKFALPELKLLKQAASLGIPSFLTEMSTGVSIFAFNWVLLKLSGNAAVAAYGVIANIAIVVLALSNGIALGVQPIASREYGKRDLKNVKAAIKLGLQVALGLSCVLYFILVFFKTPIVSVFNHDHSTQLAQIATHALPLYFISVFFASQNLVIMLSLVAIEKAKSAFTLSLLRGYFILISAVFIFAALFGLNGVWLSVPFTEACVCALGLYFLTNALKNINQR
ncbi:MATE family efflux transporter [Ligilactobacillus murinus]|uniref:MATE family efflux transporter n=1 Tax=Ligilactobacillus murinus TaxID=1622 RepID=UPI0035155721